MQSRRRNKKTHFNVTSELFVCRGSEPPLHTLPPLPPSEDIPPPQSYAPTFQGDSGKLERYVLHFLYSAVPRYHTYFYIRARRLTEHHLKSFSIKQSPPAGMKGGRLDVL